MEDNAPVPSVQTRKRVSLRNVIYQAANRIRLLCTPKTGVCVALGGNEARKIRNFFGNFVNAKYLIDSEAEAEGDDDHKIRKLGEASVNGFVIQFPYYHKGVLAHAVLKSSRRADADNLAYEYLVGRFLNAAGAHFPCFLETYAWLKYRSPGAYKKVLDWIRVPKRFTKPTPAQWFTDILQKQDPTISADDFGDICANSNRIALLVQHIAGARTLEYMMKENKDDFCKHQLVYVLFQVYMPLATMHQHFTHYDLHANNVLVFEPIPGDCIHFRYHFGDGEVVEFYSPYLVKIIDYGRCFFDSACFASAQSSSDPIKSSVHETPAVRGAPALGSVYVANILKTTSPCSSTYDTTAGFRDIFLSKTIDDIVETTTRNVVYDLYLAKRIGDIMESDYKDFKTKAKGDVDAVNDMLIDKYGNADIVEFFTTKIKWDADLIVDNIRDIPWDESDGNVCDVNDMLNALKQLVIEKDGENEAMYTHFTWDIFGTLNVYADLKTNMDFRPKGSSLISDHMGGGGGTRRGARGRRNRGSGRGKGRSHRTFSRAKGKGRRNRNRG